MEPFLEIHPLDKIIRKIDVSSFSNQEKEILGTDLIQFFKEYGIASFGNGFLQTLHPLETGDLLKHWPVPKENCYPFLKMSFGTIYFKMQDSIGYIDPVYKDIETNIAHIKIVLNLFLCNPEFIKNACFKDIHDEVYPRLGLLDNDEIYAFVPALALGGARSSENVEKVKLREHLGFLSQL